MEGWKLKYLPWVLCAMICSCLPACTRVHGGDTNPVEPGTKKAPVLDKFAWQPIVYDTAKRYIYLSFDDGPQHGTVSCYEICRYEGVKASFFMVGLHSARKSDGKQIVSMIRQSYPQFLLANHSYTHANGKYPFFYKHPLMAEEDFLKAQDSLRVPYKILRLPGNNAWAERGNIHASWLVRPVTHLLDSAGYNIIGWDLEWHFNHKTARPVQTPAKLAAQVDTLFAHNKTHTPNHLVILSHDRMFQHPGDVDSLAKFIAILKRNPKYVFETADHYPGVKIRR